MKLSNKAVEILIAEIAGKETVPLVMLIRNKEHVSEFKIAEKMDLSVNQIRNMLYRLVNYNMVSFIRKKDKKKGWYIYYWTFKEDRALEIFDRILQLKIDKLNELLKEEEQEQYYTCKEKCTRFNLTDAMEHDFKCPECGQLMELEETITRINKIKKRLDELSKTEEYYVEERVRKPRAKKQKKVKKKPAKKKPKPKRVKRIKNKPKKKKISKKSKRIKKIKRKKPAIVKKRKKKKRR